MQRTNISHDVAYLDALSTRGVSYTYTTHTHVIDMWNNKHNRIEAYYAQREKSIPLFFISRTRPCTTTHNGRPRYLGCPGSRTSCSRAVSPINLHCIHTDFCFQRSENAKQKLKSSQNLTCTQVEMAYILRRNAASVHTAFQPALRRIPYHKSACHWQWKSQNLVQFYF